MAHSESGDLRDGPTGLSANCLNVPEPDCRPSNAPDFSDFEIPKAEDVPRPRVDMDPDETLDLAISIVRVLNKESDAVGDWARALAVNELRDGLPHMRTFDAPMQNA